VLIHNLKSLSRGALKAIFDVQPPDGMILVECCLFEKDGRHWVTAPQKQYRVGDATKYKPAVTFVDRATAVRFSESVLKVLRAQHPEAFL
jgi:hypothetical protein